MRYQAYIRSRYRVLWRYIGLIWMFIAVVMLSPLLILPFYPEEAPLAPGFLLPAVPFLLLGFLLYKWLYVEGDTSPTFQEGMAVVVVAWLAAALIGALPLLILAELNVTQAIFEATSGWTGAGLTVVDVTEMPRLILIYRSILQLVGGAGFVIIVLSAITGTAGAGLTSAEGRDEQLAPHVRESAEIVVRLYVAQVILGIIGMLVAGMPPFDAVNHTFTALATGGFSTHPESIGFYDSPAIEFVTIVLMILGSINFLTAYIFLKGKWRPALRSGELLFLFFFIAFGSLLLLLGTVGSVYGSLEEQVRVAVFETTAALSTAGLSITTYTQWNDFGILVLIILMVMGGSTGSTAGGIKLFRIYIMLRSLLWEFQRAFLPEHAVNRAVIWRGEQQVVLQDMHVRRVALFILAYGITLLMGTFVLVAHGYPLRDSIFEFASTLSTVGLSVGITQPDAPPLVLWTQIIGMLAGRLEFFALVIGLVKLYKDTRVIVDLPKLRA